eukprot:s1248_g6.t1
MSTEAAAFLHRLADVVSAVEGAAALTIRNRLFDQLPSLSPVAMVAPSDAVAKPFQLTLRCEQFVRTSAWSPEPLLSLSLYALLKGERHLPLRGYALKGDVAGLEKLSKMLAKSSEPMVVKPRHGSNSKHVFLWPRPQEVDASSLEDSVLKASESHDKSWDKARSVVLQPLYAPLLDFLDGKRSDETPTDHSAFERGVCPKFMRPLELKIQVLFGEVVGAQLNTHPQYLWVARDGSIHLWDQTAAARCESADLDFDLETKQ